MNTYANGAIPAARLFQEEPSAPAEAQAPEMLTPFPFKRFEQQLALDVDSRADRIFNELNSLTSEIYATIYQAKARLLRTLQEEVKAMFAEILTKEDAWRIPTLEETGVKVPSILREAQLLAADPRHNAYGEDSTTAAKEMAEAASPTPAAEALDEAAVGKVYEGTLRLKVQTRGRVRQALQFVHDLGQLPQINVLRLMGDQREEMDVWIGLREPMALGESLGKMQSVAKVQPSTAGPAKGAEPQLSIWLKP